MESDLVIPNSSMDLILEYNDIDYQTCLIQIGGQNICLYKFQSSQVEWSSDEKYLFYLLNNQLNQFQPKTQRKRKLSLFLSYLLKVEGKLIFAQSYKRNNKKPFSLYEVNKGKLIRSFINMEADDLKQRENYNINLIQDKIFVFQIQRFNCNLYPHILYYDISTGKRIISIDHQKYLMQFKKSSHVNFKISTNGKLFGLKSQQNLSLFNENLELLTQLQASEYFKFSECSEYLIQYGYYDVPSAISVFDIKNKLERFYYYKKEFQLLFVKLKDKTLHTIQRKEDQMMYIKININI